MIDWVASLLVGAGCALLVTAALGLFRLPDALSRQHAATKSGTLALGLLLVGAALARNDGYARTAAILAFLFVTLPVSAHMLARAAARHAYSDAEVRGARRLDGSSSRDG